MYIRIRVLFAMSLWILALVSFVLSWVNFSLLPMEATAGWSFIAVGLLSGLVAWHISRSGRRRKKLR